MMDDDRDLLSHRPVERLLAVVVSVEVDRAVRKVAIGLISEIHLALYRVDTGWTGPDLTPAPVQ
jgi:hypothetical protein